MMSWDDWFNEFSKSYNKSLEEYFTYWNNFFNEMMGIKKEQPTLEKMPPLETYQEEALRHIFSSWGKKENTLCALGVGMGKTRVACEALSRLFALNAPIRLQGYSLVCCPTTGVRDTIWVETLKDLHLETIILEDEKFREVKMERAKELLIPDLAVGLITYANIIDNIEYFINTPPNFIIFDEYHTLTNNSLRSDQQYRETIMKLPIRLRLGLTATPFINDDMESILAYGLLNNLDMVREFRSASMDKRKLMVDLVRGKQKEFLFYNGELFNPNPASEWFVSIPMSKKHYDDYLLVKKQYGSSHMKALHQVGRLSISTSLTDKKTQSKLSSEFETGKIKALKSIISHLPDSDKIVICDNQKETLIFIIEELDFIRPLKPLLYIGGKKSDNKKNIELFNNKPEYRVLLTTRQEGGEGINLQIANHLVLLNCWYTVKDIIQIIGRIKRKGQKKPTYAYILGNNLFNCIGNGLPKESYVLKEDLDFYKATRKKKEMSYKWGINLQTTWPSFKVFCNYETLENDFNRFLEEIKNGGPLKIGHNGSTQDEKHAFHGGEAETEGSYIDDLLLEYNGKFTKTMDNENKSEIQESNPDFVPQKTLPHPYDMLQDVPIKQEVLDITNNADAEVLDIIDDQEVQTPISKESNGTRKKVVIVKKKSKPTIQEINPDSVPGKLETRHISFEYLQELGIKKKASQKILPSDKHKNVPEE